MGAHNTQEQGNSQIALPVTGRHAPKYYLQPVLYGNILISLLLGMSYVNSGNGDTSILGWLFIRIALLSHFALLNLLLYAPLAILNRLYPRRWLLITYGTIAFGLLHLCVLLDAKLYQMFRFHINGMVVNVLFTPGGVSALDLDRVMILAGVGAVLLVLAAETAVLLFATRREECRQTDNTIKLGKWVILGLIVFLMVTEKVIFAIADVHDYADITKYEKTLPLYFPITFRGNYVKDSGNRGQLTLAKPKSLLKYPLGPLSISKPTPDPLNVVVILLDSWRSDVFSKDNTPEIWEFSKNATVCQNHYSGGNCTRFGVFSLFYGLYGDYWYQFLAEKRSPVILDVLQQNGYAIKAFASAPLTFPEFNTTVFVNVATEDLHDDWPGKSSCERDRQLTDKLVALLDNGSIPEPFFLFVFYDSSHGTYDYPKEFGRYTPAGKNRYLRSRLTKEEMMPLFNSYRNSILYEDFLAGKVLQSLRQGGLLSRTMVVITSDHGEEFREKGYRGHTSAFTDMQIKVPMILHIPGQPPGCVTAITSHLDIVPTLLSAIGCKNDPRDYCLGTSIFDGRKRKGYIVSSGWDECAVVDEHTRVIFGTEPYRCLQFEVRDSEYRLLQKRDMVPLEKKTLLIDVLKGFSRFRK